MHSLQQSFSFQDRWNHVRRRHEHRVGSQRMQDFVALLVVLHWLHQRLRTHLASLATMWARKLAAYFALAAPLGTVSAPGALDSKTATLLRNLPFPLPSSVV